MGDRGLVQSLGDVTLRGGAIGGEGGREQEDKRGDKRFYLKLCVHLCRINN